MEKKEFLNEESYLKTKKKISRIALVIFIVGLMVGSGFIVFGIVKTNEIKKINVPKIQQIEQKYAAKSSEADQIRNDMIQIEEKVDTIKYEIDKLRIEQRKIFNEDNGFSDRYYSKETEINKKNNEISNLNKTRSDYQEKLWDIERKYKESNKNNEIHELNKTTEKYAFLYIPGIFIIFISLTISASIYMITKQREIMAFQAQQIRPIAEEGIEKMAPSEAKAAKIIVKEISRGIKEENNDDK
ncbi:MAG: hypothetical protein J6K42_02030 [Clostridia bacterium]|nr:hypothetical protein [Clostridia bacterium]